VISCLCESELWEGLTAWGFAADEYGVQKTHILSETM